MGVPHASGAMNIINYSGGGGVRAHRYSTAEEKARGRSPTNHNNHECHYVGVPHECGAMNIINYWGGVRAHRYSTAEEKARGKGSSPSKARGRSPTNHNNHECHYVGVPHASGAMNIINYWGGG